MNNILFAVVIVISLSLSYLAVDDVRKTKEIVSQIKENRLSMYAECLESKYDKFQCYSMIYGAN